MIRVSYKDSIFFTGLAALFLIAAGFSVYTGNYLIAIAPFLFLLLCAGWQYKELIFFLLLVSLPFSMEFNFSSGLGTDLPDEPLMLLASFLFLAYWICKPGAISKKDLQHPLLLLLLLLILWTIVTVAFSSDKIISFKYLLAKSWYVGAFVLCPLILFRERKLFITAMILLAAAMLVVTVVTLYRHYALGFSFAGINDALFPFFRNHVNYSAMLVCFVPVFIAFYKLTKNQQLRFLAGAALIVVLVALFFSYARGAWLALLAGLFTYWLIQQRLLIYAYVIALIVVITSLFWLKSGDRYLLYAHDYKTTIFHKDFNEHLVATYKLKDVSTAERFYRWIAGVRMIKDNWLTGYGPNTFYGNYKPYAVPAYKTWVSDNKDHSTVHNYFLLTFIEQGLPGLLFFLLLTGAMFYYAQHLYHRIKEPLYKITAITTGVVLTMILTVNFLSDLLETDKVGSLFFLCLSVLIITDINTGDKLSDPSADV
ncbi:MAG TPA: O-antigen ligase family protein [Chitinophagaceae bacterium]|nr:O-antigen ligase family protein [Chitinophagaceae bacterium]